jgi:hypothetical protein
MKRSAVCIASVLLPMGAHPRGFKAVMQHVKAMSGHAELSLIQMCGIFGYVNYLVERDRKYIVDTLLTGLSRLEYRGYDSAGIHP